MFKGELKTKCLISIMIFLAVMITVMCTIYVRQLKYTMKEETDMYLSEISEHISATIDYRINNIYQNLESIGDTYWKVKEEEQAGYLQKKAEQYGFFSIVLTDRNGVGNTTFGNPIDFSDELFFQRALQGEEMAMDTSYSMNGRDGSMTVFYSVPLYKEGEIVGAIIAENTKDVMGESLSVESFGGKGNSHVIDKYGDFIATSKNAKPNTSSQNFFTVLDEYMVMDKGYSVAEVKEDIENKRTGIVYFYTNDKELRVMNYVPLKKNGWYLLSVVPAKVTIGKTNVFVGLTVIMNIIMVVLFLGLIGMFLSSESKNRMMRKIAYVDPVTEGPSRAKFEIDARKQINNSPEGTYALVSLDIDRFKLINDSFGSIAGDKTLKYIYTVIRRNLTKDEFVARSMADTFYILMKSNDKKEIRNRLDQIVKEMNAFNDNQKNKYYLTIMEGVYIIHEPDLSFIAIQDRANTARKNAKRPSIGKRSSCVFYSDVERIKMVQEKEIENQMEDALKNKEFVVYLQPKFELIHDTISGAEALVRWNNPEKGLIPPNEFIPVFEKNGFIVKVDLFVFEEVCKMIRRWIDEGKTPIPVSVNLSRVHLYDSEFLEEYKRIFDKYDIPAELIEIELTETVVFENMDLLIEVIHDIHKCGFTCSLDDFGSGYSSLNMLKEIPVDTLKLDRQFFVRDKKDDERGNYVVEAVIDLAKKLNMKSVSEGVERMPQVEFLKKAKCDMVQGFVFSKPITVCEFEFLAFSDKHEEDSKKTQ